MGVVYCSIYKKHLFTDKTFSVGDSFKIGEDVLMNIELALRVKSAININNIVYYYRNNPNSVMNQKVTHPLYTERYFDAQEEIYKESGCISKIELSKFNDEKFIQSLNSFFSIEVPMEKSTYFRLKENFNKNNSIILNINSWKTKIYFFTIKAGYIPTLMVKFLIHFRRNYTKFFKKKIDNKKEVVY